MPYQDVFQLLVDVGLVEVILPFILVFTITYGVLKRTNVLGGEKPKEKLNIMVAFVMGFFAVLAANLLNVINIILFYFVLLLVIGLLLALVLGLSGAEGGIKNRLFIAVMSIFAMLFIFFALAQAGVIDKNRFTNTILLPVIILVIISLTVYFVFREKPEERPARPARREAQRQPARREAERQPTREEVERHLAGLTPQQREEEARQYDQAAELIRGRRRGQA